MYDLSVVIPSRNEMFLSKTIEDILLHIEGNTEVIAVLDGEWANPIIQDNPRVTIIHYSESVGQRGAMNKAVRLSEAKYVMKVDAHCGFDQGFDVKMIEAFKQVGDNVTMVPVMKNLHAFDWKCYLCNWTDYQGAKPLVCPKCGKSGKIRMRMKWQPRRGTNSRSYKFDAEPKFGYFNEYLERPEVIKGDLTESMSLQGSCFMATRKNYWEKELCDEAMGNWGNQGIEVACKTWLSGGRVLVNHKTWYSHLFRTRQDFSFPWPVSGKDQQMVKKKVRDLLWEQKYTKMIYPVSWLVEKFMPVPGWTKEQLEELKNIEKQYVKN